MVELNCKLCGCNMPKRRSYQHYRILHVNIKIYLCPYSHCALKSTNLNSLAVHMFRYHETNYNSVKTSVWVYICPKCSNPNKFMRFLSPKELESHVLNVHIRHNKENTPCCYENCTFKTDNAETWRSHMSRTHKLNTDKILNIYLLNQNSALQQTAEHFDVDIHDITADSKETDHTCDELETTQSKLNMNLFEKALAIFFLKMQVLWHVPEYAIQEIWTNFMDLHVISIDNSLKYFQSSIFFF